MTIKTIAGEKKGDVLLYALSTCVWCKKTKKLLNKLKIEYQYIDVDLLDEEERNRVDEEVKLWNPRCSYPTLVIAKNRCIIGFKENAIREEFGK